MFGIGFFELCIIGIVILVFWGPNQLPGFMKNLAKFFIQMQRTSSELRRTVETAMDEVRQEVKIEEQTRNIIPAQRLDTKEKPESSLG